MSRLLRWLGGADGEQVDGLRAEIEALRARHDALRTEHEAARADARLEAERTHQFARMILDLAERVATGEERVAALEALTGELSDGLAAADVRADEGEEALTRFTNALARLELQLERDSGEARTVATALLQRIEHARLATGRPPADPPLEGHAHG